MSSRGNRPHRATGKADANHGMVTDFMRDVCGGLHRESHGGFDLYTANLRGVQVWAIDTHKPGGVFLDWVIGCTETGRSLWLEVKTPKAANADDQSLRDGEKVTLAALGVGARVVVLDGDVEDAFMAVI